MSNIIEKRKAFDQAVVKTKEKVICFALGRKKAKTKRSNKSFVRKKQTLFLFGCKCKCCFFYITRQNTANRNFFY